MEGVGGGEKERRLRRTMKKDAKVRQSDGA